MASFDLSTWTDIGDAVAEIETPSSEASVSTTNPPPPFSDEFRMTGTAAIKPPCTFPNMRSFVAYLRQKVDVNPDINHDALSDGTFMPMVGNTRVGNPQRSSKLAHEVAAAWYVAYHVPGGRYGQVFEFAESDVPYLNENKEWAPPPAAVADEVSVVGPAAPGAHIRVHLVDCDNGLVSQSVRFLTHMVEAVKDTCDQLVFVRRMQADISLAADLVEDAFCVTTRTKSKEASDMNIVLMAHEACRRGHSVVIHSGDKGFDELVELLTTTIRGGSIRRVDPTLISLADEIGTKAQVHDAFLDFLLLSARKSLCMRKVSYEKFLKQSILGMSSELSEAVGMSEKLLGTYIRECTTGALMVDRGIMVPNPSFVEREMSVPKVDSVDVVFRWLQNL